MINQCYLFSKTKTMGELKQEISGLSFRVTTYQQAIIFDGEDTWQVIWCGPKIPEEYFKDRFIKMLRTKIFPDKP